MAGTGRQDDDVPAPQRDDLAFVAAEAHPRVPACDAEHFVGTRMVVHVFVNAVAPGIPPIIGVEQLFQERGRIRRAGETNRAAVKQERQVSIVRNAAVVLEHESRAVCSGEPPGARRRPTACRHPLPFQASFSGFPGHTWPNSRSSGITAREATRSVTTAVRLHAAFLRRRDDQRVCGRPRADMRRVVPRRRPFTTTLACNRKRRRAFS